MRLPTSFEESQFLLVQELGAVLLHQDCRSDAKAEQQNLVEVRNGVTGAFLQQPCQVADFTIGVRWVSCSAREQKFSRGEK